MSTFPRLLQTVLDTTDAEELGRHRARAEALGARLLLGRADDPDEPLYVLADPSGHPCYLFVA